jgi:hypothetical protein
VHRSNEFPLLTVSMIRRREEALWLSGCSLQVMSGVLISTQQEIRYLARKSNYMNREQQGVVFQRDRDLKVLWSLIILIDHECLK